MERRSNTAGRIFLILMAIAVWFALIAQFYLIIINRQASVGETIVRYFTFFTILSNLLIAVSCLFLLLIPGSDWGKFFSRPTTLTAIAVSITIVGIVYNIILRFLWELQGLQLVVDELLHLVIPIAFLVFWTVFVPKGSLKWNNIFPWTIYPMVYLAVILVRGVFSGYYPYPFLDAKVLGYPQRFINCAGVAIAFIVVSLLFVAIDKWMGKKTPLQHPC